MTSRTKYRIFFTCSFVLLLILLVAFVVVLWYAYQIRMIIAGTLMR